MPATTAASSGQAIALAGRNISNQLSGGNVSVGSDFIVDLWITEAEAVVNSITRYDWVGNWSSLDADNRRIVSDVVSSLAAMKCIMYDMSGYTSRAEAEIMLDVLRDNAVRGMELLKDQNVRTFVRA